MSLHRDKYRHLRPPRPRQCFRSDGQPKRPYSEPEAVLVAGALGVPYQAYECERCGSWHVGRVKAQSVEEASR